MNFNRKSVGKRDVRHGFITSMFYLNSPSLLNNSQHNPNTYFNQNVAQRCADFDFKLATHEEITNAFCWGIKSLQNVVDHVGNPSQRLKSFDIDYKYMLGTAKVCKNVNIDETTLCHPSR